MGDTAILKFFSDNHIELKEDWLEKAVEYIISAHLAKNAKVKTVNMVGYVYEQWLYSEINQSTVPKMRIPTNASKLTIVTHFPLQIMSVVDISKPLYGQYRSIVGRSSTNNAEFTSDVDYDEEEKVNQNKREMLLLQLSDGKTTVKGLQNSYIPGLTTMTAPGAKALIVGKTLYRKGCLLLNDTNFQVLGGDSADLAETNALVNELATRLRINSSHLTIAATLPQPTQLPHPPNPQPHQPAQLPHPPQPLRPPLPAQLPPPLQPVHAPEPSQSHHLLLNDLRYENNHEASAKQRRKRPKTILDHFRQSESEKRPRESSSSNSSSYFSTDADSSVFSDADSRKHRTVDSNETLNTTNGTGPVSLKTEFKTPRKPPVPKSKPKSKVSQKPPIRPLISTLNTGNSSFNDTVLGETCRPSLLHDLRIPREEFSLVPFTNRPLSLVDQFRGIEIASLTDVLKQKKFWLKPENRIIVPILCECSRDIGTAHNQWSLMVYLSDENIERVEMILQNELLVELLGFTVQHCKQLSDAGSQAELVACKDRALQILSIFKRLDLIFTVEFSPLPNMTPIVKKVENLGRKLMVC